MGEVLYAVFPRQGREEPVSKRAMAMLLGRSERWLEMRTREGCPSSVEGIRRMYRPSEVNAWLARRERRLANA